jgi:hypothetical protein
MRWSIYFVGALLGVLVVLVLEIVVTESIVLLARRFFAQLQAPQDPDQV